jgi:hypothetical protein
VFITTHSCFLVALYERLMRESDELSSSQQGGTGETEGETSSPIFEEIMHLWEKANQQVQSRSCAE